jgi:endonuclease/exonuclease/phosphatase family metal-dependent hydrolase
MHNRMRMIFRILVGLLLGLLLICGVFLAYMTIVEYKPPPAEKISILGSAKPFPADRSEFTIFSWNIGYGGLGDGMDFFYDGGSKTRPEKEEFLRYFRGIKETLRQNDSVDFMFILEIDHYSKRSYFVNEETEILQELPGFCSSFALNYNSQYIPQPVKSPLGRVVAGQSTLSKFTPSSAVRNAYTANFSWPLRLAMLKRCFAVLRFPLEGGKEFILISTHNSTYDKTGELRKAEFIKLQNYLMEEYRKGNYVVCGGDWNNNPRGFDPGKILSGDKAECIETPIDSTFLPGWQFVYDPSIPTNRMIDRPYKRGETVTTIIDFFVISPNVELLWVKATDLGFACSDHNPVTMKVRFRKG